MEDRILRHRHSHAKRGKDKANVTKTTSSETANLQTFQTTLVRFVGSKNVVKAVRFSDDLQADFVFSG
ncbi:hypothetical protein HMPREF2844_03510 [Neisseria sp. HMSC072F04]|nr:hypothetical protein HMPREF2844_03510 [Neisseria sp. HMSC072F04]